MPKPIRLTLAVFGGLTVATALVALAIFLTLSGAPSFYQQAVDRDLVACEEDSNQCLRQAAALASHLQAPGEWQAIFSADQINGWLAVDLARNYGEALPAQITNPRVHFESGAATLACTYRQAGHETVLSIAFDLYLSEPNVIALRLRRVRAGLLPVPLADVLRTIAEAGHNFGLLVQWRQVGGDPVALVNLAHNSAGDSPLLLEAIELRDGEIYVAGRTLPLSPEQLARRQRRDEESDDENRASDDPAGDERAEDRRGKNPFDEPAATDAGDAGDDV
ncbi:MAG TPA: hypothetical protein VMF30_18565, partial [Pirellulales bacterium]|nr:hypothetical protein [Pirellulales bacterium]